MVFTYPWNLEMFKIEVNNQINNENIDVQMTTNITLKNK